MNEVLFFRHKLSMPSSPPAAADNFVETDIPKAGTRPVWLCLLLFIVLMRVA